LPDKDEKNKDDENSLTEEQKKAARKPRRKGKNDEPSGFVSVNGSDSNVNYFDGYRIAQERDGPMYVPEAA